MHKWLRKFLGIKSPSAVFFGPPPTSLDVKVFSSPNTHRALQGCPSLKEASMVVKHQFKLIPISLWWDDRQHFYHFQCIHCRVEKHVHYRSFWTGSFENKSLRPCVPRFTIKELHD